MNNLPKRQLVWILIYKEVFKKFKKPTRMEKKLNIDADNIITQIMHAHPKWTKSALIHLKKEIKEKVART